MTIMTKNYFHKADRKALDSRKTQSHLFLYVYKISNTVHHCMQI